MASIQVCESCRRRKRKCDKAKPSCSHCTRLRLKCTYLTWPYDKTAARERSSSPASSESLSERRRTAPATPTIASLTSQFRSLDNEVTAELLNIIKSVGGAHSIATNYFACVNHWLPVIYKPRFYARLSSLGPDANPNFCLLLLSMHIITQDASEDIASRVSLYHTVKSLAALAEFSGPLDAVQARLLLATFEMGRSLFPAAHISIGAVASMAMAIGLQDNITQPLYGVEGWEFHEEAKRLWWAIVIIDRYIGLRTRAGCFVTKEPTPDNYLPCLDSVWENCDALEYRDFKVSTSYHARIGPFARAAQASLLLGRSLRNLYDPTPDISLNMQEYYSLLSALGALNDIIPQEKFETCYLFCGSMGMVASAMLLLTTANPYQIGSTPSDSSTSPTPSTTEEASRSALRVARDVLDRGESISIASLCPLVPDSFSQGALAELQLYQETHEESHWNNLITFEETLTHFSQRWASAGEYLRDVKAAVKSTSSAGSELLSVSPTPPISMSGSTPPVSMPDWVV